MATEQKVTRKLRAILSADVKGYSTLMTNDEAATIQTLKEYRNIMSAIISDHSGNVVDMPGDNIMAEFSSVVNAVKSAVKIQKALKSKNGNLPNDKRLEFRIGINIGDVVQDGDSLYGEGVNIAARIEGLADPGGICISRGAYDHIRTKLKFGYEYIGEHTVKNIKHPVRVYKILMAPEDAGKLIGEEKKPLIKTLAWSTVIVAGIIFIAYLFYQQPTTPEFEPASIEKMAHPLPDKPSIAVLAFDNMSGDPNQEFFSDGISEDIITTLSKSDSLFVVARNSTFRYKGKPVDIKKIAEELGVRYVLEGSVRKSENKIRITAQLIDAVAGKHLWAERYERDIKDIFALQDEITLKIVEALEVQLTEGEQVLRSRRYTNLEVKLKFMEVLSLHRKGTAASLMRHGQVAQEVIDMAPEFEGGYVHLGWYYHNLAMMGKSTQESIGKALKLAQTALSLNESDPFAYALLSYLFAMKRDYDKAIAAGEKGVALNPNGADNHFILGQVLASVGKQDEAIAHLKQAIRLDPFPEYYYFVSLGRSYRMMGQYEEALSEIKKAHLISPDNFITNLNLAAIYALLDRQKEAEAAAKKALEIDPKFSVERASEAWPYKNQADRKLFADALVKAGFPYNPPLQLPDKPSIAVLAFDNMSKDPDQEYFCDGITQNIISSLAKVPQLLVIARNSTFAYKEKSINIQQIGRELNARYIIEGSIQKSNDRFRITAQLIDADSGHHIWSESYDRTFNDIFTLQDEITLKILKSVNVKLSSPWSEGYDKGFADISSFIMYQKLLEYGTNPTREKYGWALKNAEKLITLNPEYPLRYNYLAMIYIQGLFIGSCDSVKMCFSGAKQAINNSLSIDADNFWAHQQSGQLFLLKKEYDKAMLAFKKAIELNPNNAHPYMAVGNVLNNLNRPKEALEYLNKGLRLDPFPPASYWFHFGISYRLLEEYDKSIKMYKKSLLREPNFWGTHAGLVVSYFHSGQIDKAKESVAQLLNLFPSFSIERFKKSSTHNDPEQLERALQAFREAGVPETSQ